MTLTRVTHETRIAAPAEQVYRIVADITRWPIHFPPTIHAEQRERTGDEETIQLWATAENRLRTWHSRRRLDAVRRCVEFEQTRPHHPVAAMGGVWRIEDDGEGGSVALLDHHYRAADDTPTDLERITQAVDTNSTAELASIKRAAERPHGDALLFSFEDTETINGPAAEVYDFLNDLISWPERLPHVHRIELREEEPGFQYMEMDTKSPDGSVHTTTSWRVCERPRRIVYKQLTRPAVLAGHTGEWHLESPDEGPVRVTSVHTVLVDPQAAARLPSPPADTDALKAAVRASLGANSRATLTHAKAFVEGR